MFSSWIEILIRHQLSIHCNLRLFPMVTWVRNRVADAQIMML